MNHAVGSLVRARGREWVVLPDSQEDLLMLRPLGGTDDETTGILTALEPVESATFPPPDPSRIGDYRACRLLRDALRLGFRSSAGPFRSFGAIAVEPRPYQLVPLLLALRLDPVRLLIADDVGIGKTVEACLIARELLDRGEVGGMAVLCPPHLAEQWKAEMATKFHIDAELVLPSTAARLERGLPVGTAIFDVYPNVIVSTDYIKSDRRRDEFLRTCPAFVIVDEAHTCAAGPGARHMRHRLLRGLAENRARHLVLVTATPHSGNEEAFRSLLTLLDPSFAELPADLTGRQSLKDRERLAEHMVQRRRVDIHRYLQAETPFPERIDIEKAYQLSDGYRKLFARVIGYARETVREPEGSRYHQRVRWWSALALLRSLASSPRAAAATLRNRAASADTQTEAEADEIGRRTVLDLDEATQGEEGDVVPGARIDPEESEQHPLARLAREAEKLEGAPDHKMAMAVQVVERLLADGHHPILFCRFIPTAEYVAEQLRAHLRKDVRVEQVTGLLPPEEREARVADLAAAPRRVLVCTDCLSEGINLQESFDAVVHYDLAWNPTRHEQREGRVDRYGQRQAKVRVVTCYGTDNQIDGIVLDVLLRKHQTIRSSLGVSVPVPVDTNAVMEAILEGLLLRAKPAHSGFEQLYMPGFEEEYVKPERSKLHSEWEEAAKREKLSRTVFAQAGVEKHVDAVLGRELQEVRRAVGTAADVARFVHDAVTAHGGTVEQAPKGAVRFSLRGAPRGLVELVGLPPGPHVARFELPVSSGELYLSRTHPAVEGLASYVLDTALDTARETVRDAGRDAAPVAASGTSTGQAQVVAGRCGVIRTRTVARRTTLLLLRLRFHLVEQLRDAQDPVTLLAEEALTCAFEGPPTDPSWLPDDRVEALLAAVPEGANVPPEIARERVGQVLEPAALDALLPALRERAVARGQALAEAHRRVRTVGARRKVGSVKVEPVGGHTADSLPVDLLGVYVYLPAGK